MFSRGFICRRCQARAVKRCTSNVGTQWLGRASYIPLSIPPSTTTAAQGAGDQNSEGSAEPVWSPAKGSNVDPRTRRRLPGGQSRGRYSGAPVDLPFEDQQKGSLEPARRARRETPPPPRRQVVGTATKLDELLGDRSTLEAAWSYFLQHYNRRDSPSLVSPAYQDLKHLQYGEVFKRLLESLAVAWAAQPASRLPPPGIVAQKLEEVGVWRVDFWDVAALPIARQIFMLEQQASDAPQGDFADLADELLSWWIRLLSRHGRHATVLQGIQGEEEPTLNWATLHNRTANHVDREAGSAYLEYRLKGFLTDCSPGLARKSGAIALFTCEFFSKEAVITSLPPSRQRECGQLLKLLLLLVNRRQIDQPANSLRKALRQSPGTVSVAALDDYMRNIHKLPDRALSMIMANDGRWSVKADPSTSSDKAQEHVTPEQRVINEFSKRIQRAQAQNSVVQLQKVWQQVTASYPRDEETNKEGIPAVLFDHIIAAFFSVRRADSALDIWKSMVNGGRKPTVKTWTAMLDGCRQAKDFAGGEGIWRRMIQEQIPLDSVAWVVRISTLVQARKYEEALGALEDMGQRWTQAEHARLHPPQGRRADNSLQAAKPTIEVVNALVPPLAMMRNHRFLTSVLGWAKKFHLQLDVYTYNALIGAALKQGNDVGAQRLLREMSAAGIQPDVATFAITLNHKLVSSATADDFDSTTTESATMAALETLEGYGLAANARIYSMLVDRLLKHHNNFPAAQAVLNHMYQKGLEPSEHLYTILVDHYFSRNPPDVQAVDDILRRVETSFRHVNMYFYDRVLQGYAKSDEVEQLLRALRRIRKDGRSPSWHALAETALALERAQRFELLQEIILDLEAKDGIDPFSLAAVSKGKQTYFWGIVWRLRTEGKLPTPEGVTAKRASDQASWDSWDASLSAGL